MKKIVVDCEFNDPVDIRCGGPKILGFDFYVEDENIEEYTEFIRNKLKENKLPLMSIDVKNCDDTTPWTKEMIEKCIKDGY